MSNELLVSRDNLNGIVVRLNGCRALLNALYEIAGATSISEDALSGMCDLLECICRDFQADIDCAESCAEKRVPA